MTNSAEIVEELSIKCDGSHLHQPLISGRAAWCAEYPPRLVAAILRGFTRTLRRRGHIDEFDQGITVDEPCPARSAGYGGVYYDEMTGAELPEHLVEQAIREEIEYMRQLQVYEEVDAGFMKANNLKAIGTRWVIVNKGDAKNPSIRARSVAQETKNVTTLDPAESASTTFAATPPLEAVRIMASLCMSGPPKRAAEELV